MLWSPDHQEAAVPADESQPGEHIPDQLGRSHEACSMVPTDSISPTLGRTQLCVNLLHPRITATRNPSTTTVTSARSANVGRMRNRMPQRAVDFRYQTVPSVGNPKETIKENVLLGLEWGCKPSTAHQRKLRLPSELATVIRVKRALGALNSLTAYLAPVEAAQDGARQPDGIHREAITDPQEDLAQEAYRVNPCRDTARALIRCRASMRQASLDADREIAEQWEIQL